jgi:hypothetical protein
VWRGAHCRLRRNREAGKVGDEGGNALIKGAQQGDRGGEWAVRGSMWRRRMSGGRIRPMCRQSGRPGRQRRAPSRGGQCRASQSRGGGGSDLVGPTWKRESAWAGPGEGRERGPKEEEEEWAQPKMNSIVFHLFKFFSNLI